MKAFITLVLLLLFVGFGYYVFVLNGIFIPSPFHETYSDGWYGFSFDYPKGGEVYQLGKDTDTNRLLVPNPGVRIYSKGRTSGSTTFCDVVVTLDAASDNNENETISVAYHGLIWKKKLHTGSNTLYDASTVAWVTKHDSLLYSIRSSLENEKLCEQFVSSFTFTVRKKVSDVSQTLAVREAAEEYINLHYSGKGFIAGSFIQENYTKGGGIIRAQEPTTIAIVAFDDLGNAVQHQSFERKPLIVQKMNKKWTVVEEPDAKFIIAN